MDEARAHKTRYSSENLKMHYDTLPLGIPEPLTFDDVHKSSDINDMQSVPDGLTTSGDYIDSSRTSSSEPTEGNDTNATSNSANGNDKSLNHASSLAFVDFRYRRHFTKSDVQNEIAFASSITRNSSPEIIATAESDNSATSTDSDAASESPGPLKTSFADAVRRVKTRTTAIMTSKPMQRLAASLKTFYGLWKKRPKCPYTLYIVVMALIDAAAVTFIQWGMYWEPTYADSDAVDETTKLMESVNGQLTKFVAQMWMENKLNWLLNFCALGMIYLVLVFVLNRFWVATAVFSIVMSIFAVANSIKVQLRSEPVLPSDLSFVSSGNTDEIASFIPQSSQSLVNGTITMLIWLCIICLIIQFFDGRRCVIPFHWWRPFRNIKTVIGNLTRIIAVVVSITLLWSFTWNLGTNGSWSYNWAAKWGDSPIPWSTVADATANGPAVNFLRLAHAKTMDKPEDYSEETMAKLAKRYAANAASTNQFRANNLTDSTVIMILSESFSDPTRVPGVAFAEDPMPNIRTIKDSTTSGLMLSSGIGGGTANIEHQALTGLSLALFDDSMQSPYQELVPHQKQPFSFNQIWNNVYGKSGSVAFHPYYKSMYLRDSNYKKFGFNHLYTLDSKPAITHQDRIDNSPYISDAASYQNVIDALNGNTKHPQFIQLITMQNHAPYSGWYIDNQFNTADISELSGDEKAQIDVYAKGINITDQDTAEFLNQLNAMDKPITVIFYGDHLPGLYSTASKDQNNSLILHETDYFIWSNQASASAGAKLDPQISGFTSSNYFMPLAAEHMNAKISPYLEMLTEVPAINRMVSSDSSWGDGDTTYLNAGGEPIKRKDMSKQAKQLIHDYKLVQYDMTKGKNYLGDSFFNSF